MPHKSSYDLRRQVGELMIMGFEGTVMSERLRSQLQTLRPGGVILFKRNIEEPRQTHALLRDLQKLLDKPTFRCVDMEGGTVDRLRDVIAPIPSAHDVACAASTKLFSKYGKLIGRELKTLGFNTDFAPCVDLRLPESTGVLGPRTLSSKPEEVVRFSREFLAGLRATGILGCGKHFPGLGGAKLDSHHVLPSIARSWEQVWTQDLLPYRELQREFPLVMVGHIAYSKITGDRAPASLSKKWITDVLRAKIHYRGLVVSDDLDMGGVLNCLPVEEAAQSALKAGCDMFLVCQKEESVLRAYDAVYKCAERDSAFAKMLAHRTARVMKFKGKSAIVRERVGAAPTSEQLATLRRRVWEFAEELRLSSIIPPEERPL
jgi:beta-N-acetylhexosaminidase